MPVKARVKNQNWHIVNRVSIAALVKNIRHPKMYHSCKHLGYICEGKTSSLLALRNESCYHTSRSLLRNLRIRSGRLFGLCFHHVSTSFPNGGVEFNYLDYTASFRDCGSMCTGTPLQHAMHQKLPALYSNGVFPCQCKLYFALLFTLEKLVQIRQNGILPVKPTGCRII